MITQQQQQHQRKNTVNRRKKAIIVVAVVVVVDAVNVPLRAKQRPLETDLNNTTRIDEGTYGQVAVASRVTRYRTFYTTCPITRCCVHQ